MEATLTLNKFNVSGNSSTANIICTAIIRYSVALLCRTVTIKNMVKCT